MKHVKKFLWYQILTAIVLTGIGLLFEFLVAISLLIGAMISTLGTGILALGVFNDRNFQDPEFMLQRFYIAEMLKIVVVISVFTIIFLFSKKISPLAVLGAYFFAQSVPTALAWLQDDEP
jgi:ATP synthase protein I